VDEAALPRRTRRARQDARFAAGFHGDLQRISEFYQAMRLALHQLGGAIGAADLVRMQHAFDAVQEAAGQAPNIVTIASRAEERLARYRKGAA
jgi:hypothetical protein